MKPLTPISDPIVDDWRLHATARLAEDWVSPWTGQLVPKDSRITVSFNHSVHEEEATNHSSAERHRVTTKFISKCLRCCACNPKFEQHRQSVRSEVAFNTDKEAFDYLERMIEAVVLAFTALEAFVNESVPEDFVYARHSQSRIVLEATNKSSIERHVSIDEKLTYVLPEVFLNVPLQKDHVVGKVTGNSRKHETDSSI